MKKIIWVSLVLISLQARSQSADSLLRFIAANPAKSSLYLVRNDTVMAKLNEQVLMPLASTVKIMVAIEFAKQAAQHVINEETQVALKELDKYYLPNTDGGAHEAWLAYAKNKQLIHNDSVSLLDAARGMTMFSSNANTEYLMDLLGLDNVKNNIQLFGLKQHTAIFPLVASLFMYQNPHHKSEASVLKAIKKLPDEQYCRFIYDIHNALKYDSTLKQKFRLADLTPAMQQLWSDRLPASTTKDYARICKILNDRKYFDDNTYGILAEIMETIMENPLNRSWLLHAGMKGGNTAWVLTKALYATTKTGTRIELVYFFNQLTLTENQQLQRWMNAFELQVLQDENFRRQMATSLQPR